MTFDFTEQQLGYLINTLAQRPYAEVAEIIASIQRQLAIQSGQAGPQPVPHSNGAALTQ